VAPSTYFLPGRVVRGSEVIVSSHLLTTHAMKLADVRLIAAQPLPSLIDEIGFILQDEAGNRAWIRETDFDFHWLANRLNANALLGENWYARAEAGEYLVAQIPG
jgi:hypothetical protein